MRAIPASAKRMARGAARDYLHVMARIRADQLLVERGLAESRTRAQALILAGLVYVGERKLAKAGDQLAPDTPLDVRGRDHPWVSRGGIKLDHALTHFGWDVAGGGGGGGGGGRGAAHAAP